MSEFCKKFNFELTDTYDHNIVDYLVVPHVPTINQTKTAKLINAVVDHKIIMHVKWVTDSLKNGKRCSYGPYRLFNRHWKKVTFSDIYLGLINFRTYSKGIHSPLLSQ